MALVAGALSLVLWMYAPTFHAGFVYEDFRMTDVCTLEAPVVAPPPWWRPRLTGRPLTQASWCWQQGQPVWAFHAVNLGLHLIVTGLVAVLLWQVTQDLRLSGVVALWFGVNAVNVETVAYLSNRGELIAAIGVLGACVAALQRWGWVAVPLLLLALVGKEAGAIGLVLVPLCLWWQRRGIWALVTALGAVLLWSAAITLTAEWWATVPVWTWLRLQLSAIVRVLLVAVLPLGQTVDYDYARVPMGLSVVGLAALSAGCVWAWRSRSRQPLRWLGACWTLLAVAPRLIVPTPLSFFAEHHLYLPLVGMALVVASFCGDARP